MVNTLDINDIRYLNLFNNVTRIRTKYCFTYNNVLFFAVPRGLISKAIGEDARNLRKISELLRKRIKIVAVPTDIRDARGFIEAVVSPVTFKDVEVREDEIILNAGAQSKAALIGRNRRRFLEMQGIIKDFFKKDFRIA